MKVHIPSVGERITLTDDWTFSCFNERRNAQFLAAMRPDLANAQCEAAAITLDAGTVLTVRRIYIRSGASAYDSVTFSVFSTPTKIKFKNQSGRFWAKLEDVNEIKGTWMPRD